MNQYKKLEKNDVSESDTSKKANINNLDSCHEARQLFALAGTNDFINVGIEDYH